MREHPLRSMAETSDDVRKGLCGELQEGTSSRREVLAPDNPLLVQEVIDDFDAIAHLYLGSLGHGQHSPDQLARLHIMQGRNALVGHLFKFTAKTSQWETSFILSLFGPVSRLLKSRLEPVCPSS